MRRVEFPLQGTEKPYEVLVLAPCEGSRPAVRSASSHGVMGRTRPATGTRTESAESSVDIS